MTKQKRRTIVTRRIQNVECVDVTDPNKLPIVSGKEEFGGKTTVVTAVLIDGEKGWFDEAATHGRTPLEQDVTWKDSADDVPNGRHIDIVWLYIRPVKGEYTYHGATASWMVIDEKEKTGYKYLADHANQLSKAIRGEFDLERLNDRSIETLIGMLNTYPEVLENSADELREALGLLDS